MHLFSCPEATSSSTYKTTTPGLASGDITGEEYEEGFGGDTLYIKDLTLVRAAYKAKDSSLDDNTSLKAYILDMSGNVTNSYSYYFLASRYFAYSNDPNTYWDGRRISDKGSLTSGSMFTKDGDKYSASSIRPIITLKSNLAVPSGDGQSLETAWNLQ